MLNLKLDQVNAFLHIVRSGGKSKAADTLHLSPTAITARIKNLEMLLGVELFKFEGGVYSLSEPGEGLYEYAEKIEYLISEIEQDFVIKTGKHSAFRFGVTEVIAQTWVPKIIKQFRRDLPELTIDIEVDTSSRLHMALEAGELDMAVARGLPGCDGINTIRLPPTKLYWYTSSDDNVYDEERAIALFGKPIIALGRQTESYRELRASVWQNIGTHVQIFPNSSVSSALGLVAAGIGVAVFPADLARGMELEGSIHRFDPKWHPADLEFNLCHLMDPTGTKFEKILRGALDIWR